MTASRNTYRLLALAGVGIFGLLTLVGSGGGGGEGGGGAGGGVPVTDVPRFAYAVNLNDHTVSIYTVNAETGQLRHKGYVAAGTAPRAIALDPLGRFVYVANQSSGDVSGYTIDTATGRLTPIVAITPAGDGPFSITVDPTGKFAYVANNASDDVSAYTIDAATGVLTRINCGSIAGCSLADGQNFATGDLPVSVAADPSGKFAYVTNQDSDNVSAYTINAMTGALTAIDADAVTAGVQNFAAGDGPRFLAFDPSGRFVYAVNLNSRDISAFAIDAATGSLTAVDADSMTPGVQNVATGFSPRSIAIDPSGRFAYVANFADEDVSAYAIDAATGALTPIDADAVTPGVQDIRTGTQPNAITVDASGKFVYVVNSGLDNSVSAYAIDSATGALTALPTVRGRNGNVAIAMTKGTAPVTYTPKFAYVTNASANTVSAYTVNASTGVLTPHAGGAVGTRGSLPFAGTADPAGRFAYAANAGGMGDIAAYTIDAVAGGLTPIDANTLTPEIDNFVTGLGPESITAEPSGRFVYVAASGDDTVSGFRINANGSLSPVGGAATGDQPRFVTVDPAGKFAYVVNFNPPTAISGISAYTINGTSGLLMRIDADPVALGIQDFPTGTGPRSIAVDPTGKFAYVTNTNDDDVSAYTIDAATGALASIGATVPAGIGPVSVTIDPSGRFAYVANATSGDVSAYTIDAATGVLTSIGAVVAAGGGPRSITVDPSGKFAYVANFFTDDVSTYTINAATGALTPIGTAAAGDGSFTVTVTGAIQ